MCREGGRKPQITAACKECEEEEEFAGEHSRDPVTTWEYHEEESAWGAPSKNHSKVSFQQKQDIDGAKTTEIRGQTSAGTDKVIGDLG